MNSTAKTALSFKYDLDKSFHRVIYRTDNCIDEGSGWVIESINGEYVKIFIYSPLSESSYNELSNTLRNWMKGLINIKKMTKNVFFGAMSDI